MVVFWNGIRMHVPKNLAVWIPASHHEQIIRELQAHTFRPCCSSHTHCDQMNWTPTCCMYRCLSVPSSLCLCPVQSCPLLTTSYVMNNQERKSDQMKELPSPQETKTSSPSPAYSSSSEDEEEDERLNAKRSEMVSCSVNTDISCLKKPHAESQGRPAWRYWRRGSPEPHHKQPGNPYSKRMIPSPYKIHIQTHQMSTTMDAHARYENIVLSQTVCYICFIISQEMWPSHQI